MTPVRADPPTREAWKQRLEPALAESLAAVSRVITNEPAIQAWLQAASFEAAMGLETESDMQAAAMAYGRLLDDLAARFAPLVEAVREVTDGLGRLDIHWRPLSPQYTTLYVNFNTTYKVNAFVQLRAPSPEEAQRALEVVARHLPKGLPFPGRPNTATGLAAYAGRGVGVRLLEHHAGGTATRRNVTLLPKDQEPIKELPEAEAARRLAALLG